MRIRRDGRGRVPKPVQLVGGEAARPTRSSSSPPENRGSFRVRDRRHGRPVEGALVERGEGAAAAGDCSVDAREKEIAGMVELVKESVERKLREIREREEQLETLGNYIEERRIRVRENEVEVEKRLIAVKAEEKEMERRWDELKFREGELIAREERIEELESKVQDYERRLGQLEKAECREPEVVRGCSVKKKSKKKKQKDKSMVCSSQRKTKEKEWFDAFARGLVEKGQKEMNGDAVDMIQKSSARELVKKGGELNLVKENNEGPDDQDMECNVVIDLASLENDPKVERKKVMHRLQTSVDEQHKKRSADSVAELVKKISERNEGKGTEWNAVKIKPIVSAKDIEPVERIRKGSTELHSAERQLDAVKGNGVGSKDVTGASSFLEMGKMGSLENRIQDDNGAPDLQREQSDVVVSCNLGVTEKESGCAQWRLVQSCGSQLQVRQKRSDELMCGAMSLWLHNLKQKEHSVDSVAELIKKKSEGNQENGTICSGTLINSIVMTECSSKEKELTKLHSEELQLYSTEEMELGSTAATGSSSSPEELGEMALVVKDRVLGGNGDLDMQCDQLDTVVESPRVKEEESGCAEEPNLQIGPLDSVVESAVVKENKTGSAEELNFRSEQLDMAKQSPHVKEKELGCAEELNLHSEQFDMVEENPGVEENEPGCAEELNPQSQQLDMEAESPERVIRKESGCAEELNMQSEQSDMVVESPGGVKQKEPVCAEWKFISSHQAQERFKLKRKQALETRSLAGKRMRKNQPTRENPNCREMQQLESTLQSSDDPQKETGSGHLDSVDDESNKATSEGHENEEMECNIATKDKEPAEPSMEKFATKLLPEEKQLDGKQSNELQSTTPTAPFSKRYETQKGRDWKKFTYYYSKVLKQPTSSSPGSCTGSEVVEYLKHMDKFGKTRVHIASCADYGNLEQGSSFRFSSCGCPLKQAWGSQDSLVGRLRAACEDCGVAPESNPFGSKEVRNFLKGLKEEQDKARGTSFMKKKKRRKPPATASESVVDGNG